MSDAKKILETVLNDEKLLNSKAFREKVYSDIPILRTASQLKRPATPQRIREMKAFALTPEAYWRTSAWLFVQQGEMMADYDDDYEYSDEFVQYYPTYRDLTTEQLRGYFCWRKYARDGIVRKSPPAFHFIYVYELLNGIGSEHGKENFVRIDSFCKAYSSINEKLMTYRTKWLTDYAICHDLDNSLLSHTEDNMNEKNIIILSDWQKYDNDTLYDAICAMSSYRIEQSRFAQENADLFKAVLCRSFVLMSELFRTNRKTPFWTKLFGKITETGYRLFDTAVFYQRAPLQNREYIVNDIHSYICRNGKWYCRKIQSSRHRSVKLGEFVRAADQIMRQEFGYQHKLTSEVFSKQERSIINSAIAEYQKKKKITETVNIRIDTSKLSAIRKAADETRDKLLVDEDLIEQDIETSESVSGNVQNDDTNEVRLLTDAESAYLTELIKGGDSAQTARKYDIMPSVLADSVNEKLFDIFNDTVILFDGDEPELIEDYTDELKDILHIKEI